MNRTQLNQAIAQRLGLPAELVTTITDACWEEITAQLVAGEKVTIPSFGVFEVVGRRNPSMAKQKRLANFRAGKGLNEALMGVDREETWPGH